MFKVAQLIMIAMVLGLTTQSKADHTLPSGYLKRLGEDTRYLYYAVRNSSLHSGVKRAVNNFTYNIDSLLRCADGPHSDVSTKTRDHDLLPEHCEYYLRYVHYTWYDVDRYLWDSVFDYPFVYNAYLRVRSDMQDLPH